MARKISGENFQIPKRNKSVLAIISIPIFHIFDIHHKFCSNFGHRFVHNLSALIYFSFGGRGENFFQEVDSDNLFLSSIIFSLISLAMAVGVTPVPVNQSNLLPGRLAITGSLGYWRYCFRHRSYSSFPDCPAFLLIIGGLLLSIPFLTLLLSAGRAAILGFLLGLIYLSRFGPLELKKWLKLAVIITLIPILGLLIIPMIDRIFPGSSIVKILNSIP